VGIYHASRYYNNKREPSGIKSRKVRCNYDTGLPTVKGRGKKGCSGIFVFVTPEKRSKFGSHR
jgi:hypothetical protein